MGNAQCSIFYAEKIVCPPKLLKGLFTTSAVDNIDQTLAQPKTAIDSLYGTGIFFANTPHRQRWSRTRRSNHTRNQAA